MGLLQKISRLGTWIGNHRIDGPHGRRLRQCRFEEIESRRLMTVVPPIHVGSVYYEQASGDDLQPNILQFTFEGGAPGTQLKQIIIDGDKDGKGISAGDMFFDTAPGGYGVFRSNPLQIISHDGFTVTGTQVVDGGMRMVINLDGFEAGETLTLSIDVDEFQFVDGNDVDVNAVAEGGEFQRSHFITSFTAPHYYDVTIDKPVFWDEYDNNFSQANTQSGTTLDLPPDRYLANNDLSDLTAGAVAVVPQVPKPNSLSGTVFLDNNLNNIQDTNDPGIAGVTVRLQTWDGHEYDDTNLTTITDTHGNYHFDGLAIGKYRVVEVQPAGYRDVGATAGKVNGQTRGVVTDANTISEAELFGDENSVHNDFAEYLPVSVSGRVHVNTTGDCADPTNPPLAGVTVQLLDSSGRVIDTRITGADGMYHFDDLRPGTYGVHEIQPIGYFSGATFVGSAGGVKSDDLVTQIVLPSGTQAVHYDFCEIPPVSISGYVYVDMNNNGVRDPGEAPIGNVTLGLIDANGNATGATVTTDSNGFYKFSGLRPGTYGVVETQPVGYLDGRDSAGSAGGVAQNPGDRISGANLTIGTNAVNYNFGELLPVSISGRVHINTTGDCADPTNPPLSGVTIQLLDEQGNVLDTRITGADGMYHFENLPPGTYSVHEIQPAGYFSGATFVGSAGGVKSDDLVTQIVLVGGTNAVHYDFCEIPPSELCGFVYVDTNNNGIMDAGEVGIGGVTVQLLDGNGNPTGAIQTTDVDGSYCFEDLHPGTYGVREIQPPGYFDGLDTPGTAGGTAHNPGDEITGAVLPPGFHGEFYNFGELPPASIGGRVHVNTTGDCANPTNPPLAGVTVHLLDAQGNILATRITDSTGHYLFDGLAPGTYSVEEIQPTQYFNGATYAGTAGGTVAPNLVTSVFLAGGVHATDYDFCEIPPAMLSGHVFQDGPAIPVEHEGDVPDVLALRDGKLTPDDTLLPGVTVQLRDGVTGLPIYGSAALTGLYAADQPITAVTNANGYYEFRGLHSGTYSVYYIMPSGYYPGIDTAGSTGGVVVSQLFVADPSVLDQLQELPQDDGIVQIPLALGQHSSDNNFSVVTTVVNQIILPPPPGAQPPPALPGFFNPLLPPPGLLPPQNPFLLQPVLTRAGGQLYTWHLSVVDAGFPRGPAGEDGVVQFTSYRQGDDSPWQSDELDDVEWTLASVKGAKAQIVRKMKFGMRGGIPVSGDFNGDGKFEVGVFKQGYWFIDLNGNGTWDEGDLWAKLGHKGDLPVTGDWNGDGKTDIGIYGPAWRGDPRAIINEPGMPDPHNEITNQQKNIPRPAEKTAIGRRELKLTERGKSRSDLIDHVFLYGTPADHPVVGDWNGDGIDTIAIFRDGRWRRDMDGDGRRSARDQSSTFGQRDDLPVVGDFNGDGVEELAIFRNGTWYIDTNGNGVIDNEDQTIQLGGPGDMPVAGDWDGDGTMEIGVYHDASAHTARR